MGWIVVVIPFTWLSFEHEAFDQTLGWFVQQKSAPTSGIPRCFQDRSLS